MSASKGPNAGKLREIEAGFYGLGSQPGQTPSSEKLLKVAGRAMGFIEGNSTLPNNDPAINRAFEIVFEAGRKVEEARERNRLA